MQRICLKRLMKALRKLRLSLDDDVKADIQLINSYDEDEVGSLITNNYICISKTLDIRGAMHELIKQAGDNDNISTIYVVDENGKFSGAIDLKDLIIARQSDTLDSIIIYSYPYFYADEKISDSIEKIKDYAEDSLPVLNRDKELSASSRLRTLLRRLMMKWARIMQNLPD